MYIEGENEFYFYVENVEETSLQGLIFKYEIKIDKLSLIYKTRYSFNSKPPLFYYSKDILAVFLNNENLIKVFVKNTMEIYDIHKKYLQNFVIDDFNWKNFAFIDKKDEVLFFIKVIFI